MRIGLASLPPSTTREQAVSRVVDTLREAASRQVKIVCFPETYVPGYQGMDFAVIPHNQAAQEAALQEIARCCGETGVAAIVGMEWQTEAGLHNIATVIDTQGNVLGYQTKNQLDPS